MNLEQDTSPGAVFGRKAMFWSVGGVLWHLCRRDVFPAAVGPPSDVPSTRHDLPAEGAGEIVTFLIHSAPTSVGSPQMNAP